MNSLNESNIESLIPDFNSQKDALHNISSEIDRINTALGIKADDSSVSLEALRREALKCYQAQSEMLNEYQMALGLDFVSPDEAVLIQEVADARQIVAAPYLKAYNLEVVSSRILRAVRERLQGHAVHASEALHAKVSECRKVFHAMFWSLPDLGMTFDQWGEMPEAMRKKLRPAGRPGMPLECRMLQNQAETDAIMEKIVKLSGGEIQTLGQAIVGVSLSNRGRPSVSPLVKLDRKLANLRKELETLLTTVEVVAIEREEGTPGRLPASREEKIDKTMAKMRDLEAQIASAEAELQGVDVPRRELEKLRSRHREMVVMETTTSGSEQARLLLEILKNEEAQIDVINLIYEMDADAKETPTHQVNPKATRDRIARLRMNGQLRANELKLLAHIEERMRSTKVLRAR